MAMGGVGEAALLGAAMGGGSALLTGRDPLQGAIMGTLTGGAGAGITSLLPGTAAATTVLPQIAPTVAAETAAATLAPEVIASNAANTIANATPVLPQNVLTPSALPAFNNGIAAIPTSFPTGYFNENTITQVQDSLIRANSGYNPDLPTQLQQNLLPNTSTSLESIRSKLTPIEENLALRNAALQYPQAPAAPSTFMEGMGKFASDPIASIMRNKPTAFASALAGASAKKKKEEEEEKYSGPLSRFKYNPDAYRPSGYADGGIASLGGYDRMVGEQPMYMSDMARGGIADLGSYSDGGRMLKGPGDGMSDNIPATIAGKRPARLADGEFVIPADVVSHLGNGSSDAGAKQLYAMMDKVRKARTGRKAQGREINPRQYMAA
jgi:hypothetical protein